MGLLGTGAQDVHLDFHTAPELCTTELSPVYIDTWKLYTTELSLAYIHTLKLYTSNRSLTV